MSTSSLFDQKVKPLPFGAPKDAIVVRPEGAGYFVWFGGERMLYFNASQDAKDHALSLAAKARQDVLIYESLNNIKEFIERERAS